MKYVSTADDKLAMTHKAEGDQSMTDPLEVFDCHQTGDNMSTALPCVPSPSNYKTDPSDGASKRPTAGE